jgi:hypothetical protein
MIQSVDTDLKNIINRQAPESSCFANLFYNPLFYRLKSSQCREVSALESIHNTRRPWISLTRMMTTAATSRIWTNPPSVELVTSPRIHKSRSMIAMVVNMSLFRPVLDVVLSGGFLNAVADGFHVPAESPDGAAACAQSRKQNGGKHDYRSAFEWFFHDCDPFYVMLFPLFPLAFNLGGPDSSCHGVKPYLRASHHGGRPASQAVFLRRDFPNPAGLTPTLLALRQCSRYAFISGARP